MCLTKKRVCISMHPMLRIRLRRRGKNKYATYRVVVAQQHAPVKGRFVADLGAYNPHSNELNVEAQVAQEWIKQGAKPSSTVHNLFVTHKIIDAPKVRSWSPKVKKTEGDKK